MITATSINSINVKGDGQIDINAGFLHTLRVRGMLHDSQVTLTAPGLRDLSALNAGTISNSFIDVTGSIGSVNAIALSDSQIYAGTGLNGPGAFPPASGAFAAQSSIASINLRKASGVVNDINSSIAADIITKANLGSVQFSNGGKPFGLEATDINSLTAADSTVGKPFHFTKLISADVVTADLAAKAVTPQDFTIDIV